MPIISRSPAKFARSNGWRPAQNHPRADDSTRKDATRPADPSASPWSRRTAPARRSAPSLASSCGRPPADNVGGDGVRLGHLRKCRQKPLRTSPADPDSAPLRRGPPGPSSAQSRKYPPRASRSMVIARVCVRAAVANFRAICRNVRALVAYIRRPGLGWGGAGRRQAALRHPWLRLTARRRPFPLFAPFASPLGLPRVPRGRGVRLRGLRSGA